MRPKIIPFFPTRLESAARIACAHAEPGRQEAGGELAGSLWVIVWWLICFLMGVALGAAA